jgi:hypothetical protein
MKRISVEMPIGTGVCAMRCAACGAEMLLVKVAPDAAMISSGYSRYTLQCLGCYEVAEHLCYNRERSPRTAEPGISALTSAGIEQDNKLDESEVLLKRAIEMIRPLTIS